MLTGSEDEAGDESERRFRNGMMEKGVEDQLITGLPTSQESALMNASSPQQNKSTISQHDSPLFARTSMHPLVPPAMQQGLF